MSNISKKGQGDERHADPDLLGEMDEEDTREGVERTSRVGKGT